MEFRVPFISIHYVYWEKTLTPTLKPETGFFTTRP